MALILQFSDSNNSLKMINNRRNPAIPETMFYQIETWFDVESDKHKVLSFLCCYLMPCRHSCLHRANSIKEFSIQESSISWLEDLLIMANRVGDQETRRRAILQLGAIGSLRARQEIEQAKNDLCQEVRFTANAVMELLAKQGSCNGISIVKG
jgi:hypothetical protein